jgi:molybdate transport system permease protein
MPTVGSTVFYTLCWASLATLIVTAFSLPLAYLLARKQFWGKHALSTLVSMPLVLPPTAIGYLLLQVFADQGILGRQSIGWDLDLLLNWKGVVLACSVMSFPLVIRTVRVSFEEVNPRLEMISLTLGVGPLWSFSRVTLPLASRGIISAMILGFTRAMGEFGATVMIAGNIPGKTQTLASAIYSAQQSGNEAQGWMLLSIALLIGFTAVFLTEWLTRPTRKKGAERS